MSLEIAVRARSLELRAYQQHDSVLLLQEHDVHLPLDPGGHHRGLQRAGSLRRILHLFLQYGVYRDAVDHHRHLRLGPQLQETTRKLIIKRPAGSLCMNPCFC